MYMMIASTYEGTSNPWSGAFKREQKTYTADDLEKIMQTVSKHNYTEYTIWKLQDCTDIKRVASVGYNDS